MNFLSLENTHKKWREILVIGKTTEQNNEKYHIVGMTLEDEVKLYILEPCKEAEHSQQKKRKNPSNQRKMLKEYKGNESYYFNSSEFCIGSKRFCVRSGSCGSLRYSLYDYGMVQLFYDMMGAGWVIPDWLKELEWDDLQLVTLDLVGDKKLPKYSLETPITIKHHKTFIQHIIEKTVTLNVGKSCFFSFTDHCGEKVQCYINNVILIDMWKNAEEQFSDPRYTEKLSQEELQNMKSFYYSMLEQNCPEGMCYIGVEYECSKDISLQFYSKEYLKSCPIMQNGSTVLMGMGLKPDNEIGTHHLFLKGCTIQTAVSPNITEIPAELFFYFEKVEEWEENIKGNR